jgi:hypothetical protein
MDASHFLQESMDAVCAFEVIENADQPYCVLDHFAKELSPRATEWLSAHKKVITGYRADVSATMVMAWLKPLQLLSSTSLLYSELKTRH